MQIYGPYRISTAAAQNTTPSSKPAAEGDARIRGTAAPQDQLDLSSTTASGGVNRLADVSPTTGGDIRIDKVADLRRQIANGNYDTAEKLDAALDRMLDAWA